MTQLRQNKDRPRLRGLPAARLPTPPAVLRNNAGHSHDHNMNSPRIPNKLRICPEQVHQWITNTDVSPIHQPECEQHVPSIYTLYPPNQYTELLGKKNVLTPNQPRAASLPFTLDISSTISVDAPSSSGSTFSPVQTEQGEPLAGQLSPRLSHVDETIGLETANEDTTDSTDQKLICLGPQCHLSFRSDIDLRVHVQAVHTHTCSWAGCLHPSFVSRQDLAWHVKVKHLLICPVVRCCDRSFQSHRELLSHVAVEHPNTGKNIVKEWELPVPTSDIKEKVPGHNHNGGLSTPTPTVSITAKHSVAMEENIQKFKAHCQDRLWDIVEKNARKSTGNHQAANSPRVPVRISTALEAVSFPIIWEHAILPFLKEFMPTWAGPRHMIFCTRGRAAGHRQICITTKDKLSESQKSSITRHIADLLPENYKSRVSIDFAEGEIDRSARWARGLSKEHPDQVMSAKNPYHFSSPCMGDSVGIPGHGDVVESTATLGPCLNVGGGTYWLVNFHPFLEAYQSLKDVDVEHPSPQDREPCLALGHDCLSGETDYNLGSITVTSGLNLRTTRISHDPYWEVNHVEQPLVVTDWALIASSKRASAIANILRRFPSETQPPTVEPLVSSVCGVMSGITPGASVVSSGRTSGYQKGFVCEIPAYVSAEENSTGKATREWFVEEPPAPWSDGDSWIRGGIGVEGDSGAAIVDAESKCLYGQLWGRNKYWGSGPRIAFFTPAADIFDDIQEKCGLQGRPKLPHNRDEADRYAVYPSCRQCYDARTYLDSRRSSRASLQSMINYKADTDHDLASIENVSELATPRDYQRGGTGVEETGALFTSSGSPVQPSGFSGGSLSLAHLTNQYPGTIVLDENGVVPDSPRSRDVIHEAAAQKPTPKRGSLCLDQSRTFSAASDLGLQPKRKRISR